MKAAIVYHSEHHGNTKSILDAIALQFDVELIRADDGVRELPGYDLVGFASGIYFSKFHASVMDFAREVSMQGRNVFLMFTSGLDNDKFADIMRRILSDGGADVLGTFSCRGLDTFGPFKLFGGISKGHPNDSDRRAAVEFYRGILERASRSRVRSPRAVSGQEAR